MFDFKLCDIVRPLQEDVGHCKAALSNLIASECVQELTILSRLSHPPGATTKRLKKL